MAAGDERAGPAGKAKRTPRPKPVTADWLFRAGAHYLERYASSAENLRRVLRRKVKRRADAIEADDGQTAGGDHESMIAEAIDRFAELGLLDDRTFAEARLRSLRRSGISTRAAAAKLGAKGVDRDTVEAVLAGDETDDRAAARRYAARRRLGPHRLREREERRERDLAAMMRAGFAYPDAKAAIDGEPDPDTG